jgi:predicted ATP-grasp superfamily ATP-dependent carboligase
VFIPYLYREDLSRHIKAFEASGVRLLVAGPHDVMTVLENKPQFLTELGDLGIKGTPFLTYDDIDSFQSAWDKMAGSYDALCIKPSRGIYGAGFCVVGPDIDDLTCMMTSMRHKVSLDLYKSLLSTSKERREMMLMPYLQGVERSVDFACLDGELIASVTRRKCGRTQIIEHDEFHHNIARRIVQEFGLSGVLNLQTLEDTNGVPYVLEVNSRTSGGIHKTLHSGVNLPLLLLRKLAGKRPETRLRATSCRVGDITGSVVCP